MVIIRKMKEKCKDAARMRREKERVEFVELSKLLPLPSSITSQLDKASIIRLTSSYLRMRSAFPQGLGENWGTKQSFLPFSDPVKTNGASRGSELASAPASAFPADVGTSCQLWNQIKELGSLLLQTLDGFIFALHRDGKIMYISETASVHLGLPQIDLTGSSVFDYIHPADHNDIMDILNLSEAERARLTEYHGSSQNQNQTMLADETVELGRSFCMRMKCVLPKRNAGLVSNGYKAIHCSGYLKARCRRATSSNEKATKLSTFESSHSADHKVWDSYALVAVGHSLLSTASTEIKLDTKTFMFRTNLDLRLHFIEALASNLLGYQQSELVGQSLYQFVHVADLHHLELAHKQVLEKSQVVSKYYRLMCQGGGYVWVQTYATIVNNPRSMPRPQHIVGICRVIGESLCDDSRLVLIGEPLRDVEPTSFAVKKALEYSSGLESQAWVSGQSASSLKPVARLINKCNRSQKRTASKQHHASRASRSYDLKKLPTSKPGVDVACGNVAPGASRTIGSTRRTSDDSCSIVSSVASSVSSHSASSQGYSSSSQTTHPSPSYHATTSDQTYGYRIPASYIQDQDYRTLLESTPGSNHPNQYSSAPARGNSDKCQLQDYWSRFSVQFDKTSYPISIDTSIDQGTDCWPAAIATTVSPTLTTPTAAPSQGSADGSPVGGYTLSPERACTNEQYYYRLHGQVVVPCDSYHNDDCNAAYSNGTQVYMDYTQSDGSLVSMPYDDHCAQTFYYPSQHEASYLASNGSA